MLTINDTNIVKIMVCYKCPLTTASLLLYLTLLSGLL